MSEFSVQPSAKTWRLLQERADALHDGNIEICIARILDSAMERYEYYRKLGLNISDGEPFDPWGVVEAQAQDKATAKAQE